MRENQTKETTVRLNKFLSEAGVCSRREADRLIENGKVTVDGKRAEMGMRVSPSQRVCVGKKEVRQKNEMVLLAVNKPVGIVCTEEKKEKNNIIRFLNYPTRVTYIGRLDKDSEGLLLMTNNGDIINKMMRAGNQHEKEYKVTVNKPVTKEFIEKMPATVEDKNTKYYAVFHGPQNKKFHNQLSLKTSEKLVPIVEKLLLKAKEKGEIQLEDLSTAAMFCVYGQLGILLEDGADQKEKANRIRAFLIYALHL